jgi:hypothetical protein
LRLLELIFWDKTWLTYSSGQNIDPSFFFSRQHLWSHLISQINHGFNKYRLANFINHLNFFEFLEYGIEKAFSMEYGMRSKTSI